MTIKQSDVRPPVGGWVGRGLGLAWLAVMLAWMPGRALAAETVTQTIALRAGWNSVYLEVSPTNPAPAAVFAGLPVKAVWTPQSRRTSVDFISDPNEPVWNRAEWLVHVPTNRVESLDNNLFAIPGGRAYLVEATAAATLRVTGTPFFRAMPWVSDAYNLRGFPVDPGAPPTFRDFFGPSPAHFDNGPAGLTEIHRLANDGRWVRVAPTDLMEAGRAYWVFSRGASDYQGPLGLDLEGADGLEFAGFLPDMPVRLSNHAAVARNVTVSESGRTQAATALTRPVSDPEAGIVWQPLPAILQVGMGAAADETLRIGIRRAAITGAQYASVVEIRDNAGTRYLLPVTAQTIAATAGAGGSRGAALQAGAPVLQAGLWLGTISMNRVSEVHSGNLVVRTNSSGYQAGGGTSSDTGASEPLFVERTGVSDTPTPTRAEFQLRALIHVDSAGQPRLLREVYVMWRDGTTVTRPDGLQETDKPGRYVLVTDEARLAEFEGATVKDGTRVGRRLSTAGFDFPVATTDANFLPLTGRVAGGTNVTGTINLGARARTNPFRHKFHPDHDNLAANFVDYREEAFPVTRAFRFNFAATDPQGSGAADYGYSELAGTYRETVTGLHRRPIVAEGTFRLRRVSQIPDLNPPAQP